MTDYLKFLSLTGRHLHESAIRRMGTVVAKAEDLVSFAAGYPDASRRSPYLGHHTPVVNTPETLTIPEAPLALLDVLHVPLHFRKPLGLQGEVHLHHARMAQ